MYSALPPKNRTFAHIVAALGMTWIGWALTGCGGPVEPLSPDDELRQRLGIEPLAEVVYPADNPRFEPRIALGRLLFFDPVLGGEEDVACGTCHHPAFHFADGRQFGAGVSGVGLGPDRHLGVSAVTGAAIDPAGRNTPTVLNAAFIQYEAGQAGGGTTTVAPLFWDGRANGLEAQALIPIGSRSEMRGDAFPGIQFGEGYLPGSEEAARSTVDSILHRVRSQSEYLELFRAAFPNEDPAATSIVSRSTLSRAIAAYERELVADDSPFDRWLRGEDGALDAEQKAGLELFFGRAQCSSCHNGPMLSSFRYVVSGVPSEGVGFGPVPGDDTGRESSTDNPDDRYRFRVPPLRNVELTAPYMHSGVFATLEEVVRFYNAGSEPRHPFVLDSRLDPRIRDPLGLTDDEMASLVRFLRTLTDPGTGIDPVLLTVPDAVPSGLPPVFGVAAASRARR